MVPYERFAAWKECHSLAIRVYKATVAFPKHELYGLTSQVRRAAFSAAVNIVEGSSRRGSVEFRRFLDISLGYLDRLVYQSSQHLSRNDNSLDFAGSFTDFTDFGVPHHALDRIFGRIAVSTV